MTREERFAKKFAETVNHRDFDVAKFAYYLANESPHVQAVAVRTGLYVTDNVVALVQRGFKDSEYGQAIWLAKELNLL